MPTADASQFTRLKKALAVQKTVNRTDAKSVNHLTQFIPHLSAANNRALNGSNNAFLPSVTLKDFRPKVQVLRNVNIEPEPSEPSFRFSILSIQQSDVNNGNYSFNAEADVIYTIVNNSSGTICIINILKTLATGKSTELFVGYARLISLSLRANAC